MSVTPGAYQLYAEFSDLAESQFYQVANGYSAAASNIVIYPCKPVLVLAESLSAQYEYTILESPPLIIEFQIDDTKECGYTWSFTTDSQFATVQYPSSFQNNVLKSPFSNSITISTLDQSLASLQVLKVHVFANDQAYGALSNTEFIIETKVNIIDPCVTTPLYFIIEKKTLHFAANNYTAQYLNLTGSLENDVGQTYTLPEFCGSFKISIESKPNWLKLRQENKIFEASIIRGAQIPSDDFFELKFSLKNYPDVTTIVQIDASLIMISRSNEQITYAADQNQEEIVLSELQIQSVSPLTYSIEVSVVQSDPPALEVIEDPLWLIGMVELTPGFQIIFVEIKFYWAETSWTTETMEITLEVLAKQIYPDLKISANALTNEDTTIDLLEYSAFLGSIQVEVLESAVLIVDAGTSSIIIASPFEGAVGDQVIQCQIFSIDYPRMLPQSVEIIVTVEQMTKDSEEEEELEEQEEVEPVEAEAEQKVSQSFEFKGFSFFFDEPEEQKEEEKEKVVIPYLTLLPFGYNGLITVQASCELEDVGDPNIYLTPLIPVNDKKIPSLSVRIKYEDPQFIKLNGLGNTTLVAQTMTAQSFVLNFTFPKPGVISQQGYSPDNVEVELLSPQLLKCADGRKFTQVGEVMTGSIPLQISAGAEAFLGEAKESVSTTKLFVLVFLLASSIVDLGLDQFMIALNFIGFMAIEFGVNLVYPSVSLGFFGQILGLINADLLSEYETFEIPYEPSQEMAEVLSPNIGQIGFDSCSIILNLGSLVWFIGLYIVQVVLLALCQKFVLQRLPRKISRKIKKARKQTFFNGILSSLNDNLLVFVFSAVIRLKQKVTLSVPLNLGIEDLLMVFILVVLPIVYLALGIFLFKNFDALKNPYTDVSLRFGNQMSSIHLYRNNAVIAILASNITQIRTFVMAGIIVCIIEYSWLQLILFNFLMLFETMFILYFAPFSYTEQLKNLVMALQAMFFNYLLLTQSNLVIDPETKNTVSWAMVAFVVGILGFAAIASIVGLFSKSLTGCKRASINHKRAQIQKRLDRRLMLSIKNRLILHEAYTLQTQKKYSVAMNATLDPGLLGNDPYSVSKQKSHLAETCQAKQQSKKAEKVLQIIRNQIEAGEHLEIRMPKMDDLFLNHLGYYFNDTAPENQAQIVRETIKKLAKGNLPKGNLAQGNLSQHQDLTQFMNDQVLPCQVRHLDKQQVEQEWFDEPTDKLKSIRPSRIRNKPGLVQINGNEIDKTQFQIIEEAVSNGKFSLLLDSNIHQTSSRNELQNFGQKFGKETASQLLTNPYTDKDGFKFD